MILQFPENIDTKVLNNELAMVIDVQGVIMGYYEKDDPILHKFKRISKRLHLYEDQN